MAAEIALRARENETVVGRRLYGLPDKEVSFLLKCDLLFINFIALRLDIVLELLGVQSVYV